MRKLWDIICNVYLIILPFIYIFLIDKLKTDNIPKEHLDIVVFIAISAIFAGIFACRNFY